MTHVPPPLDPNRDPGDAWVEAPTGERYWGRFGAAGLLAVDDERGVLMQHRALWSHHGGTWGIPGGALHEGERAIQGALREAGEEAGVPADAVRPYATIVLDRGVWIYTTVLARVTRSFTPVAGDAESLDLSWVPIPEVAQLTLHPAFASAWPVLSTLVAARPVLIVDGANVVGSVPDGWWHHRRLAAADLVTRLAALARTGISGRDLSLPGSRWFLDTTVVLEGKARGVAPEGSVSVIDADGSGDDSIVALAAEFVRTGATVTVVTSDTSLARRVGEEGATVRGSGWLLSLMD
ncbi:NUDIX domain-containing protein [Demequina aurantiaca]|uniref:NUDIX domain-containing protein n=1 Tax=Demequina aurantiaca TaxID=676200 RepID=UPI000780FA64|nr:NUDIX domain-containing protein [Demequina aurantiaca]